MTRNSVLDRFQSASRSGVRPARFRGLMMLGLVLALDTGRPTIARGSGIFRDLSALDRSQPILMAQDGEAISLRSPGHPASGPASKALPAYLAFQLHGGEKIPAGTPTVSSGPQPGENAVGPMGLTPTALAQLNGDLLSSRGVVVNTPDHSYAVAMLPRYARALAHAASSKSTAAGGDSSGSTSVASILGLTPQSDWMINGIPSSKISQWFKTGTKEISHLTSLGVNGVSKTLGLKVTPTSNGYNIAAESLVPPSASSAAGSPPVPTPEPSAWVVFGLILAAAGLRSRRGPGDSQPPDRAG